MKVAQIYDLVNATTTSVLGENAVVNEDLSNLVDIGKEIIDTDNLDNYVNKLVNHIGKVVFASRTYLGGVPSVVVDSWEYGSILEKISADMPNASENSDWKLEDGKEYNPNIFYQPKVSAKFFNKEVTFEIPMSFTEKQIKQSFSDVNQLNGFLSMLTVSVTNAMTVKLDTLIMRTINNMTAQTLATLPDLGQTNVKAVNLLTGYNAIADTKITSVESAIKTPDFIKYANYVIGLYTDRISKISTLFNVAGKERFTPKDNQHLVLLSDFAQASSVYLESDTQHNELVSLPKYETVPYWQGSGTDYDFASTSSIDVKNGTKTIKTSGILGVMFDSSALGVSNLDQRVTTNYNAKAEFYTNFYKFDAGYYNDMNENFVVFFAGLAPQVQG